ncbi:MAG: sigma 54-interacting transcriptional regulator, partial [Thermoanaerobaculia bacterium]
MISAPRLLEYYVRGILQMSGARAASLFIPAGRTAASAPILIHAGEEPPLPELSSLEDAEKLEEGAPDGGVSTPSEPRLTGSRDPNGLILALPPIAVLTGGSGEHDLRAAGRRRVDAASESDGPHAGWLGLRLLPGPGTPLERLRAAVAPAGSTDPSEWWEWIMFLGGGLAEHAAEVSAVLLDPVSGLPGRSAFHVLLDQEVLAARKREQPLGLISVNPDGFILVNERFGREAADDAIREFIGRIRSAVRASDLLARFGGVTFMVIAPGANLAETAAVAEKIRVAVRATGFLGGNLRLVASAGVTAFEPGRTEIAETTDLVRRSDRALNSAKRAGGDRVSVWEPGTETAHAESFDRLSGIFTGRMAIDYRNMGLLWDAMNVMARFEDVESLAPQIVERIDRAFAPRSTALFVQDERGEPRLAYGLVRRDEQGTLLEVVETLELPPDERTLIKGALESRRPAEGKIRASEPAADGALLHVIAAPLVSHDRALGALVIKGERPFDMGDVTFLAGLGRQVGAALERIRFAEDLKRSEEEKRRRLEAELDRYRQASDRLQFEYRSSVMHDVLARAQQVAATDATVLITGESGTGKELLARTLHEMSPRREKPLVVVDCSAIAATLADSELFGHEAGAYTGAAGRRIGRLAEANGGTVLLDEIGELPLDVQAKLLRFVQEKQLTAVGGNRPRKVDVRIIAATNRDLEREAAAGRFRGDLFHRLNVVNLVVPPLRERPDDILFLAEQFLARFSTLYHKSPRRLSPAATVALLRHPWPGNVRELQHRTMQAVIFCPREELGPADLGLSGEGAG